MSQPTVEEQLTAALQKVAEMESLKEKIAQSKAEILQLKESESALKQKLKKSKGSGSKIQPGTPFSLIIKHFDFSSFGSPNSTKKVINVDDGEIPENNKENPDETGAAVMMAIVQKIKKLNEKFEKIHGVPATMEEAAPNCYADSYLIDEIAKVDLPKKFMIPSMEIYDGTTDPQGHVALYKQKMLAASILSEFRQVCMCKGFGTTLIGPALQWYINLPIGSIQSFANLINNFNQQFASSRELKKRSSDLYRITQKSDETLRVFLARFNKEKVSIPWRDVGSAVEAFRQGLLPNSDLYIELTKLEETKSYKVKASCNSKEYEKPNRKSGGRGSSYRSTPYSRPNHSALNLAYEQQGLIQRLDNMGSTVTWPGKVENPNPRRDNSKWCEFYMDVGYTTEDCFTLRKEVAYLLKAGYLKDLIKAKGRKEDQKICGLTSSTAKKIARMPQMKSPYKLGNIPPITFGDCDLVGIPGLHHNGLVISMQIGTAIVRRILVDRGSSVNLIMLDVLKAMKINEDQITKKSNVLVGFSGETKNTLGEIYLPTYAKDVASYERFGVLDCLCNTRPV
ncbi:uncharacterized protein LOC141617538 [Silene latifolia]|uniref:uncharacterized protein LOC141617538 n=1 Tax=Silene latifolia TaxID=37657 RepID=UPI003D7757FF